MHRPTARRCAGAPTLAAVAALLAAASPAAAQDPAPLRDPALPYGSWGEAARETAAAIGDRPLARPADGVYAVGDAVIFDDGGKRYRAHVVAIESGRYVVHYDGFAASWQRRADADALLGYQPGYAPAARPAAANAAAANGAAGGAPQVGDELEAQSGARWYAARVIAVRDGAYRVHYDGQPSSKDEWVPASRLRRFPGPPARTLRPAAGKYACTASSYNGRTGTYEFTPKGAFVLAADGAYQYLGFAQPSPGRYAVDAAAGTVTFAGGHLDGGEATPMVQRPGKYYLTAPRIGERWTCTLATAR
jgi:hypothetical protein